MQKVLVDANVLYSRTLRDWIALLSTSPAGELFACRWTEDIMAEAIHAIRKARPDLTGGQIAHVRESISRAFGPDGLVRDYEVPDPALFSDPHDAHVHGAALACGASILVTSNVKDFQDIMDDDNASYEVFTPDEFLLLVNESAPECVREVIERQVEYLIKKEPEFDLPGRLKQSGAVEFARVVAEHLQNLDIGKIYARVQKATALD
ncbi:PIN domain-containing protein [Zhihengliuella salsuginis]|uniref:PIN domain-containing protein n=1 Tax=Zhihengliuella salsuginis TaxID=578222 RepID=A0ABQ3GHU0_9MICC|nr:PIN domain-containing protein [Zhihengliuella salsuginis]GHD07558.1 hypothetical protein GCM10008096_18430 [Zhihengliuella salsuginis]